LTLKVAIFMAQFAVAGQLELRCIIACGCGRVQRRSTN